MVSIKKLPVWSTCLCPMLNIGQMFYIDMHERFSSNQNTLISTHSLAPCWEAGPVVRWSTLGCFIGKWLMCITTNCHALGKSSSAMVCSELQAGLKWSPDANSPVQRSHLSECILHFFRKLGILKKKKIFLLPLFYLSPSSANITSFRIMPPNGFGGSFCKGVPFWMLFWLTTEKK